MNIISIGTDRKIFEKGSAVRERMIEYGKLFTELHIIVFARKSQGFEAERISENVWVYPTNTWSRFFYIPHAYRIADQIIREKSFTKENTVITTQDPFETGAVGLDIKRAFTLPLHIQIHTDFLSLFFGKGILNRVRIMYAKQLLARADRIRVVSDRIKQSIIDIVHIPESAIDVLPIFVEHQEQEQGINLREKYPHFKTIVLMVGRLAPEKNIPWALGVFKKALGTRTDVGMVIVGDGPEKSAIEHAITKYGLSQHVVIEPWQKNLQPIYASADIFFHASRFEGYGMVLVEAALARLPIISSNVGIAGTVLENVTEALVYDVEKTDQAREHLSRLLADEDLRKTLGNAAYEKVQKVLRYDKNEYLRRYKESLEKALKPML